MQVSWEATPTTLQPVDMFVVVVEAARPPSDDNAVLRSRRARAAVAVVPSLLPGERWELETNETSLRLLLQEKEEEGESSKSYMISVCAANDLGRTCSEPQRVRASRKGPEILTPAGIRATTAEQRQAGGEREAAVSLSLVLAISVVVPTMLLLLVVAVVALVIVCKCCGGGSKKEYFPSRQGTHHQGT